MQIEDEKMRELVQAIVDNKSFQKKVTGIIAKRNITQDVSDMLKEATALAAQAYSNEYVMKAAMKSIDKIDMSKFIAED